MTPKRIEDIQKVLDDPAFLENRPIIQELVTAYQQEKERYLDALKLIIVGAKERYRLRAELLDAQDVIESQSEQLDAQAIHDALGEGEFCDVCTHMTAKQMDEIYERQEEEIRQANERADNLQKALDTLLDGLPRA